MMFIVVRNLKSQQRQTEQEQQALAANPFMHDYKIQRGDTIKLGRLKFSVKDFRTEKQPANLDLKRSGIIDRSASPVKQRFKESARGDEDSEEEFHQEEAVEIDCGVVDASEPEIQCKVCWSAE